MRWILLVPLLSCAVVQPVPQQALNCLESAAPGAAVAAGTAIATQESAAQIEAAAIGVGSGVLECVALALWADLEHARAVAAQTGVPSATIQAHAKAYLVTKGVTVTKP